MAPLEERPPSEWGALDLDQIRLGTLESVERFLLSFMNTILAPLAPKNRLAILNYHRVLPNTSTYQRELYNRGCVTFLEEFEWQLRVLKEYFNVLPLREAVEALWKNTLPARAIAITFDDGYQDNFEFAFPALHKKGLSATFFITTGFLRGGAMWNDILSHALTYSRNEFIDLSDFNLGVFFLKNRAMRQRSLDLLLKKVKYLPYSERCEVVDHIQEITDCPDMRRLMMNACEISRLACSGMEVGAHTVHHPILSTLDDRSAKKEIEKSGKYLEDIIGRPVSLFAYPNGRPHFDYQIKHQKMVEKAGYFAAFSTSMGVALPESSRWELPRFMPWASTPERLRMRLLWNYFRKSW